MARKYQYHGNGVAAAGAVKARQASEKLKWQHQQRHRRRSGMAASKTAASAWRKRQQHHRQSNAYTGISDV